MRWGTMGSNDPTRWSTNIICDCEGPNLTSQEWSTEMVNRPRKLRRLWCWQGPTKRPSSALLQYQTTGFMPTEALPHACLLFQILYQENMIMMVDYKKKQLDNCCWQVSPPADNLNSVRYVFLTFPKLINKGDGFA